MHWHIDTDIVSLIVMAAVYIFIRTVPPDDAEVGGAVRNARFKCCLETGIGITAIDIAASVIMEVPTTRFVYHLFMTPYFVFVELVIVEWFLYVLTIIYRDGEKERKTIARIVVLIYLLYAVFTASNPWTGLVYSLGGDGAYSRGPLFAAMIVLYAFFTLSLFLLILIRWKKIPKEFPGGVLLMTPVILALAIAVQLSIPGWLLIMPAYMICLVLAFLFLQTMRVRSSQRMLIDLSKAAETDKLTGLFNRVGMEAMVQRTLEGCFGQSVVVLIADIDDLKTINDTMGHAEGDRSIKLVAEQLKNHFRSDDTVVRYGGDEFLAFFTGSFDEAQIQGSMQRLVSSLSALRIGENNDVPLHGSVGAAFGIVGKDSFETLCNRADAALYHVKRSGKNGHAFYRPGMEQAYRGEAR